MPPPSGFCFALGFLIMSVLLVIGPRYLEVPRYSFVALRFYGVATLGLMLTFVGLGIELSDPNVSEYLRELFLGELPESLWGSPSRYAWAGAGAMVFFLLPLGFLHVVSPKILSLRGIVGLVVKSLTLVLALFCAFWASFFFAVLSMNS